RAELGLALALDARRHLRPDLRLLVMSATLDGERVAALPGEGEPAPVVTSEARAHPVEVRRAPRRPCERLEPAVVREVVRALRTEPDGDVLVFLPCAAESARAADQLAAALPVGVPVEVRRLKGALPAGEQDAGLAAGLPGRRTVGLAPDIAETSLTVEDTSIVVDAGLARRPVFD